MLAGERLDRVLRFIQQNEVGRVSTLAQQLGVSAMTIRRDLKKLEKQGHVKRIYGGAVLNKTETVLTPSSSLRTPAGGPHTGNGIREVIEPPLDARWQERQEEKTLIGAAAAELIRDGDVVVLDAGSSTLFLAKHLRQRKITLVTNSLPVMSELAGQSAIDLIGLGGEINHHQKYFFGPLAEHALRQMRIDKVFLGIHGIQTEHGLSESTFTEVPLKRLFLSIAREIIVLADSSKIGTAAFFRVCPVTDIHKVVTNEGADEAEISRLRQAGVEVIVARHSNETSSSGS